MFSLARCFAIGDHLSRSEITSFVAKVNEQQSGRFQVVYDLLFAGVDGSVMSRVENMINSAGGCRKLLTAWTASEPFTDLKNSVAYDLMSKYPIYHDE